MTSIAVLDVASTRKLSAGQVITSVTSALKELLENSFDAGARSISIMLHNSGLDFISVEDDGSGIPVPDVLPDGTLPPATQCPLMAQRATTKLHSQRADPLTAAREENLGFRGEALHSLAQVSVTTIHTLTEELPTAIQLKYDPVAAVTRVTRSQSRTTPGTTVIVEDLFKELPVRRRDLEKNRKKQLAAVVALVKQYALPYPHVRVVLSHQEVPRVTPVTTLVATSGSNDLQRSLAEAYGGRVMAGMEAVDWQLSGGTVKGFVSRVGAGRLVDDLQVFSLDGRLVDLPRWAKAVTDAFVECHPNAAQRTSPAMLLSINTSREAVYDVNLAPNKRKVLMEMESKYTDELRQAALGTFRTSTDSIDVDTFTRRSNLDRAAAAHNQQIKATLTPISATSFTQLAYVGLKSSQGTTPQRPPPNAQGLQSGSPELAASLYSGIVAEEPLPNNLQESPIGAERHLGFDGEGEKKDCGGCSGEDSGSESDSHSGVALLPDGDEAAYVSPSHQEECSGKDSEGSASPVGLPPLTPDMKPVRTDAGNQRRQRGTDYIFAFRGMDALAQQRLPSFVETWRVRELGGTSRSSESDEDAIDLGGQLSTSPGRSAAGQRSGCCVPKCPAAKRPRTNSGLHLEDQTEKELALRLQKASFFRMRVHGQFNHGFILASLGDDMFVIDQHAADEKYNYEQLMQKYSARAQPLVIPVAVSMEPLEVELALEHKEELLAHGFAVAPGEASNILSVVSVPVLPYDTVRPQDVVELIQQLVHYGVISKPLRSVWHSMATKACRSSIMIGTALAMKTMESIVSHLGTLDQPWNCPHGRPTLRHIGRVSAMLPFDELTAPL